MAVVLPMESRMTHISQEELGRLEAGSLSLAELARISAHLRTCPECATKVAESRAVRRMMSDVRTQIEAEDGYGDRDLTRMPAPARRRWVLPLAAALAALIAAVSYVAFRPSTPPREAVPVRVETPKAAPAPAPKPAGYGREEWDRLVAGALANKTLAFPAVLQTLLPPDAAFRGAAESGEASLSPNGIVVFETRPQFRWQSSAGGRSIVILALAEDRIVQSDPLTARQWRPPFDLARGREYAWQIEIDGTTYPRAPRPPARFRVLGAAEAAELDDAKRRFPDDHLLQAVLLAKHGLRDQAEAELLEYRSRGDALVADGLLRSIRAWPSRRPSP
jgi:hypothetical protein